MAMEKLSPASIRRYERQTVFAELGLEGQRRLMGARALIVGAGGLGSWCAELLARAGTGLLRLVDNDRVELNNLHRQSLYCEADAASHVPKVEAARQRIGQIASSTSVEIFPVRMDRDNIDSLARDVDLIVDGTDNFAARFVMNDYSVKAGKPWIFAGAVGAECQVMTVIPGRTACLRCIYDAPPPPCMDPSCRGAGVLGPAVATIAAMQALEAVKILSGRGDLASPYLLKLDLWNNQLQRIDAASARKGIDCPCCGRRRFDYLEP